MKELSRVKCFGGVQLQHEHEADTTRCTMQFSIYLPSKAESEKVPVLYWLSGLTCTDQNFVTKAGAQQFAQEYGVAIVCPDTSPRGEGVADDPEGAWDLGLGAGFYVNATEQPWGEHYHMYDYVVHELPALIEANFPVTGKKSISGHSMGGHGALVVGLNNANHYESISAFAPIVNPSQCPWGQKAFTHYLGHNQDSWLAYDATVLIENQAYDRVLPVMINQGLSDNFLQQQLLTKHFKSACDKVKYPIQLSIDEGYDHSYFYIASFIREHIAFHANALNTSL
ncbi:S-formylglutathione hydrolase [Endozoicomonas sp. 4G]|uniref:S-formylglutathione hydrolase n=1 Tax=Endozoicomonas sp. 4G TaxID=2872754 RepID=UPI002078603D|nr:S-formylglutathione hydrolase [Endozoicomonas sp. 4G]